MSRKKKRKAILQANIGDVHRARKLPKAKHPPGMIPGVKYDSGMGRAEVTITLPENSPIPAGQDPCWEEFLIKMGFGKMLEVLEVTEIRAWDVYSQSGGLQTMHYVKAKARRRGKTKQQVDIERLCQEIKKRSIKLPKKGIVKTPFGLIILLADWQAGKREGAGLQGLIDRLYSRIPHLLAHIKELSPARLIIACMGDLVEGCGEHYPMGQWGIVLDRRQQMRVVRRLLVEFLIAVAPLCPNITVVAVGGNHGENRKNGKAFTSFGDNDDVAVVEQVMEVAEYHPSLKRIKFIIPDEELTATIDVFGVGVAFAHGHQCKSGNAEIRPITWWTKMAHNNHSVGSCTILCTGHYHHTKVVQTGPKTWIQAPALDGGSKWYEHIGGDISMPGILTFLVGKKLSSVGWDDLKII